MYFTVDPFFQGFPMVDNPIELFSWSHARNLHTCALSKFGVIRAHDGGIKLAAPMLLTQLLRGLFYRRTMKY